jgi:hypothetical protein
MTALINSSTVAQMKYVVQCFISDKTGRVVRISEYTPEQLEAAYVKACEFYGAVLPVPDNGRYEDYVSR